MADKTVFNISPYYDDYDEDKNFLRILFRPGYAVQARELTQAQTILQKQVQRFGDHVFEDGSKVIGAGTITRKVDFVRLAKTYTKNDGTVVTFDPTKILDYELIQRGITGADGNLASGEIDTRAKVVHVIDSADGGDNDNYHIAFVEFFAGSQFAEGTLLESTILSEEYSVMTGIIDSNLTDTRPVNGKANLVSVDEGVFYTDGFFVKNQKSTVVPYNKTNTDGIRSFENPSCRVGFNTERNNVTSGEDETLRDPSSGSYNFNAPGGDRYKIKLELEFRADSTAINNEDFIEIMRFDSGNITYKLDKTKYAELEKTLARRTYDESGSYTVQPFGVDMREHLIQGNNRGIYSGGSSDYLAVGMLPGKAYVFGHEYETQSTEYISTRKGRKTDTADGVFDFAHGNYFEGTLVNQSDDIDTANGGGAAQWLFDSDIDVNEKPLEVFLCQNSGLPGAPNYQGTAKIHRIDRNNDGNFRIYVYDIKMDGPAAGPSLANVDSIYAVGPAFDGPNQTGLLFQLIISTSGVGPHSRDENTLLFPLKTGSAVKSLANLKYSFKKKIKKTVVSTDTVGSMTFSTGLNSSVFAFDETGLAPGNVDKGKFFIFEQRAYAGGAGDSPDSPDFGTNLLEDAVFTKTGEDLVVSNIGVDGWTTTTIPEGLSFILVSTVVSNDISGQSSNATRKKNLILNKTTEFPLPGGSPTTEQLERKVDVDGNVYYEFPYSDIFKINSITGMRLNENDEEEAVAFDPSGDLLFDNGQRDNEYLKGRLYVKESVKNEYGPDGFTAPSLTVEYEYFQHEGGPGPFTVDSYAIGGCTYDDIPLYTSKNLRKTFSLANCIDFRHSVDSQTTIARIPDTKPTSSTLVPVQGNYDYYLSRIDKVVINNDLNGDGVFDIIEGVDAIVPKPPAEVDGSMSLYSLTIPAYTHNPSDVGIKLIENKRYTMRDLGRVENRLNDIEYFTTLSLLENEIDSRIIYTAGSTTDPAFKNGILVDGFRGHNIGDVTHIDYQCSVDYEKGHLRPSFKPVEMKLNTPTSVGSDLELSNDGLLTFVQGPTSEYINQSASNTLITVNPFNLTNWIGTVSLSPMVSRWFDTSSRPTVKINTEGENDNWKVSSVNKLKGFGTQWNDWESIWYGIDVVDDNLLDDRKGNVFLNEARVKTSSVVVTNKTENNVSAVTRDAFTTREEKNRVGLNIRNLPGHLKTRIGDKVVDRSVVPFIEEQTITINAYGLKPLTMVYAFFDSTNVDAKCVDANGVVGPFTTSWDGSLRNITFTVEPNTFETGDKLFRLIDDSQNRITEAVTSADGIFYAHGLTPKRNGSIVSTRPLHLRRITANSEKVIRNPFAKEKNLNLSKYTNWLDPMSQVFYVDDVSYPNGLFLNSVDLYLGNAHETIPIKLDIRESFNGSPSPSAVVPFSEVWKSGTGDAGLTYDRDDSTINSNNFKFSSPVFLEPGEYAICLSANSSEFEVHGGVIGELASDNLNRITSPVYSGPVFRSSNNRAAEVDNTLTCKYKLNRCVFKAKPDTSLVLTNTSNSSDVNIDSYRFNTSSIVPSGTSVKHVAVFDSNREIIENTNNTLSTTNTVSSGVSQNTIQTTLSANSTNDLSPVTPVVDLGYSSVIAIENIANNLSSFTDELPAFGDDQSANAKYISRRVTLQDGFESKNIKVFLDLNQQGATADVSIDVFVKTSSSSTEKEFDNIGYVKMEAENSSDSFVSENQFDFREVSYTLPATSIPTDDQDRIKSFAVKICMYASNSANVPLVKDLRIVALDS